MTIEFSEKANIQLEEWATNNKKIHAKIINLIKSIITDPYTGIGKPEPLKGSLSGFWSRRINREHRLVYTVENEILTIYQCKFHY